MNYSINASIAQHLPSSCSLLVVTSFHFSSSTCLLNNALPARFKAALIFSRCIFALQCLRYHLCAASPLPRCFDIIFMLHSYLRATIIFVPLSRVCAAFPSGVASLRSFILTSQIPAIVNVSIDTRQCLSKAPLHFFHLALPLFRIVR
jgi:hypothetical protein